MLGRINMRILFIGPPKDLFFVMGEYLPPPYGIIQLTAYLEKKAKNVDIDGNGFIITDALQHTNIAGVYAAGDVTNHPVKQVGTAVGQGITAALEAYCFIRRPYYRQ